MGTYVQNHLGSKEKSIYHNELIKILVKDELQRFDMTWAAFLEEKGFQDSPITKSRRTSDVASSSQALQGSSTESEPTSTKEKGQTSQEALKPRRRFMRKMTGVLKAKEPATEKQQVIVDVESSKTNFSEEQFVKHPKKPRRRFLKKNLQDKEIIQTEEIGTEEYIP
jgi:hypothetical protein